MDLQVGNNGRRAKGKVLKFEIFETYEMDGKILQLYSSVNRNGKFNLKILIIDPHIAFSVLMDGCQQKGGTLKTQTRNLYGLSKEVKSERENL